MQQPKNVQRAAAASKVFVTYVYVYVVMAVALDALFKYHGGNVMC